MSRIVGIDFSGAKDAGRRIWVAEGTPTLSKFRLKSCVSAIDLEGGGRDPTTAVSAVVSWLMADKKTLVGCDFPFSLPYHLVGEETWEAFVGQFPIRFPDPNVFRATLKRLCNGTEHKRKTDTTAKTPFSSYNLRMYKQTWWGIAHLLNPLIASKRATVCPQQSRKEDLPTIVEVCPASVLKHIKVYREFGSYKGKDRNQRRQRARIMDYFVDEGFLTFHIGSEKTLRQTLLDDTRGDALDAVIAGIAAMHADLGAEANAQELLEGRVYYEIG